MPIDRSDFADECVLSGVYCGVSSHFLLAVAEFRSGITEKKDGESLGPFQLTRQQWNENRTDDELEIDISEQKMDRWEYHPVVFSILLSRTEGKLGHRPSAVELFEAVFPGFNKAQLAAGLSTAFAATTNDLKAAWDRVIGTQLPATSTTSDPTVPTPVLGGRLRLNSISQARRPVAQLIADNFAKAGFGVLQQAAAIANAQAESGLNPNAHAGVGEDSWGLFQLNRRGGLGQGHTPEELKDAANNIDLTISEARKYKDFVEATSIEAAVSAFVRKVERPRDVKGQIVSRIEIAQKLLA